MDFLPFLLSQTNLLIVGVVAVSGVMLAIPAFSASWRIGLSPTEAIQRVNRQNAVWVDARSREEFQAGHIAQARHVPEGQLERPNDLPKNKPIIVVAQNNRAALKVVKQLKTAGLDDVEILAGGVKAWMDASLPLTKKS